MKTKSPFQSGLILAKDRTTTGVVYEKKYIRGWIYCEMEKGASKESAESCSF